MKTCTKCKQTKIESEFRIHRTICRNCGRKYAKERFHRLYNSKETKKIRAIEGRRIRREKPHLHLFNSAKRRAKLLGLDFNIDKADIIVPQFCPVLGIEMEVREQQWDGSPTLDRIDNTKGYVKGNVKVISWKANNLKSFGTIEDFEKIIQYMKTYIV